MNSPGEPSGGKYVCSDGQGLPSIATPSPTTEFHPRRQVQESSSHAEDELGPEKGKACLPTLR